MIDHLDTVPKLKEVRLGKAEFVINDQTTLLLGRNHSRADKFAAKLLNQEIENFKRIIKQKEEKEKEILSNIKLKFQSLISEE